MFTETGRISYRGDVNSGTSAKGYDWARQQIVLAVQNGKYTNHIAIDVTGDNVQLLEKISNSDVVEVKFYINARQWQEKWYNTLELASIEVVESSQSKPSEPKPQSESSVFDNALETEHEDDLPW